MHGNIPFKPQEYFYLSHLSEWEKSAPPDKHLGTFDRSGIEGSMRNSQTARMGKLLAIVVAGNTADSIDATFQKLERRTRRKDGNSNISRDKSWMKEPYEIARGWYFEGCMSLIDKQAIIKDLPKIGLISTAFVPCAQDFVAAKPLLKYWPDNGEGHRLLEKWKKDYPHVAAYNLPEDFSV